MCEGVKVQCVRLRGVGEGCGCSVRVRGVGEGCGCSVRVWG